VGISIKVPEAQTTVLASPERSACDRPRATQGKLHTHTEKKEGERLDETQFLPVIGLEQGWWGRQYWHSKAGPPEGTDSCTAEDPFPTPFVLIEMNSGVCARSVLCDPGVRVPNKTGFFYCIVSFKKEDISSHDLSHRSELDGCLPNANRAAGTHWVGKEMDQKKLLQKIEHREKMAITGRGQGKRWATDV